MRWSHIHIISAEDESKGIGSSSLAILSLKGITSPQEQQQQQPGMCVLWWPHKQRRDFSPFFSLSILKLKMPTEKLFHLGRMWKLDNDDMRTF